MLTCPTFIQTILNAANQISILFLYTRITLFFLIYQNKSVHSATCLCVVIEVYWKFRISFHLKQIWEVFGIMEVNKIMGNNLQVLFECVLITTSKRHCKTFLWKLKLMICFSLCISKSKQDPLELFFQLVSESYILNVQ